MDKREAPKLRRQSSLALQRSSTLAGSSRLRDAVVYGYTMLRHARQEHVRALNITAQYSCMETHCEPGVVLSCKMVHRAVS